VCTNRIGKKKIQIRINSAEKYYTLIIHTLQHVLSSPLGQHLVVKQNKYFTYVGEQNQTIYCILMQNVTIKHGYLKQNLLDTSNENCLICQSVMAKYCQF
jgi:hypothetical protein